MFARLCFAVALTCLCLPATTHAFPPTVSTRVFVDGFAVRNADTHTLKYHVHAALRGAAACDTWVISAAGPGGTTVVRSGGAEQEIPFSAAVIPGEALEFTAIAECNIGKTRITSESEKAVARVPGPPLLSTTPVGEPPLPHVPTQVSPKAVRDLNALAAASAQIALVACPAGRADRRSPVRRRYASFLRAWCAASSWSALAAVATAPRDAPASFAGIEQRVKPRLPKLRPRDVCRGRAMFECDLPRKAAAQALSREREAIAATDVFTRLAARLAAAPPDADATALLAASAAANGGPLFVAVDRAKSSRRSLARSVDRRLRRNAANLRRARAAFLAGRNIPRDVRRAFGGRVRAYTTAALAPSRSQKSLSLRTALSQNFKTSGLYAELPGLELADLTRAVAALATMRGDGAARLNEYLDSLRGRAATCDEEARSAAVDRARAALDAYRGPLNALLKELRQHVFWPIDDGAPAGCGVLLGLPPVAQATPRYSAFGRFGTGPGEFDRPTDVAVGPGGIYVADQLNSRVQRFAPDGTFLGAWGSRPLGDAPLADGQFIEPVGIALDATGTVYLADRNSGRLLQFAADGTFIRQFGKPGLDPGQFNGIYDVAVARDGTLWVADLYGYWLQHFAPDGTFLGLVDQWGTGEPLDFSPFAIAIDAAGTIYVADIMSGTGDRVLVFPGLG
jgi:hypothetical protein